MRRYSNPRNTISGVNKSYSHIVTPDMTPPVQTTNKHQKPLKGLVLNYRNNENPPSILNRIKTKYKRYVTQNRMNTQNNQQLIKQSRGISQFGPMQNLRLNRRKSSLNSKLYSKLSNVEVRDASIKKLKVAEQTIKIPLINNGKYSNRSYDKIKGYAANTHQGLYRNYNEDRISIVLNIPNQKDIHFFAIFDGHGGSFCAEFMSQQLSEQILISLKEKDDIQSVILQAFKNIQNNFLELSQQKKPIDRSGSCCIMALVVDDMVYIANLGDSRAILIGDKVYQLSVDHKPNSSKQKKRIQAAGGKLYQNNVGDQSVTTPIRVFPGRLSISRAFGNVQAKITALGGIPGVISAVPEITKFKILPGNVLILACDGIYDRLENSEIGQIFKKQRQINREKYLSKGIEECFRQSMSRDTYDNISMISIQF